MCEKKGKIYELKELFEYVDYNCEINDDGLRVTFWHYYGGSKEHILINHKVIYNSDVIDLFTSAIKMINNLKDGRFDEGRFNRL